MVSLTIITATYNAAATIADCMQSVSSQFYQPKEHIIIDGASTDNTLEIINNQLLTFGRLPIASKHKVLETSDQRPTTILLSEPDNGIYDAMNKGIVLATGDVIGILNADDFYASSDVLAKVANVFEDPAVMCCYGDLEYVKNGTISHQPQATVVRYWKSGTYTTRSWYRGWMPPHPTFFVRKEVYDTYGVYLLDLGSAADYELMLRLLLKFQITTAYIPEVLVRMRIGGTSNRSLAARIVANRMDLKAWKVNQLRPYPWTIICKPFRKLTQWMV